VQPLWKSVWRSLKRLKIELPYDPVMPLLGIYQEEFRIVRNRDTCTPMLIAVLFVITKLWYQSRCPSGNEWIKKMVYI
jgi:hypothetical protein